MNTNIKKTLVTVEQHCLHRDYAHLRLDKKKMLQPLAESMEAHGQLVPVILVANDKNEWVLMDGYLRVQALQYLKQDMVEAEIWSCSQSEALLELLRVQQSRRWEVFEEALWLRELHIQHSLSQKELAEKIGRDKSYISRRLSLTEELAPELMRSIMTKKVTLWSAIRVLAPLARANATHGNSLLEYLLKHYHSSRELQNFFNHYQQSNHPERSKMINDPGLFFKAQRFLELEKKAKELEKGSEGKWDGKFRMVSSLLIQLTQLVPHVFSKGHPTEEHNKLLQAFQKAEKEFELLKNSLRGFHNVKERD